LYSQVIPLCAKRRPKTIILSLCRPYRYLWPEKGSNHTANLEGDTGTDSQWLVSLNHRYPINQSSPSGSRSRRSAGTAFPLDLSTGCEACIQRCDSDMKLQ